MFALYGVLLVLTRQVLSTQYCSSASSCLPPVLCSPHYLSTLLSPSSCLLAPGTPGLCCPPSPPNCKITLSQLLSSIAFCR